MKTPVSDIAFTPSVKAIQQRLGSRPAYERMEQGQGWHDRVTPELTEFIAERDTFFLGTANADGQPYIQHRGGPPGFLKVIDEQTLAFADFRGNRQFLSIGNLEDNDKAFIFLIDFANRRRIKVWGRATVVEDDPELLELLIDPAYKARPERVILFHVDAWDINCPQHIKQRYTVDEFARKNEENELKNMKLDHIVILFADLESSLLFYETLLPLIGFTKNRDHVFGNTEGIYLDLKQATQVDHRYERHAPGLNHIGFTAPDRDAVERVRQAMSVAGFEVPEIQEFPNGSALFMKDGEGMRIEVASDS